MEKYLSNGGRWLLLGFWACCWVVLPSGVAMAQSDCICKERGLVEQRLAAIDTVWDLDRRQQLLAKWQTATPSAACRVWFEAAAVTQYGKEGRYDTAKVILDRAKSGLQALECPDWAQMPLYQMQSNLHSFQLHSDSALLYASKWLEVAEKTGDKEQIALAATRMAACYHDAGDFMEAMPYVRRAYTLLDVFEQPSRRARCQHMLAKIYCFAFDFKVEREAMLDTAETLMASALAIAKSNRLRGLYTGCYNDLASFCVIRNKYDEAFALLDSAEVSAIPGYNDVDRMRTHIFRSDVHMNLGQNAKAVEILENGLASVPMHQASLRRIYFRSIYRKAKLGGDLPKALSALETWKKMEDSLFTEEKARAMREFEAKYERAKKDNEIRELNQAQELRDLRIRTLNGTIVASVAIALVIILGLVIVYRQRLQRSRQALSEAEARLNRARINPHAFFNMLSTLQAMALDPESSPHVPTFLARYARLMRITLETTYSELIPLDMELQYLEDYLALQALRLPGKFKHTIVVDPGIEETDCLVPSLLLQPLAENAIEHGFQQMAQGGELRIRIKPTAAGIVASVEDNGKADTAQSSHEGFPSRSSQILDDRIALLNFKRKGKSRFALTRERSGNGYAVEIYIPQAV